MTPTVTRKNSTLSQSQVALHLMVNQLSLRNISTAIRNESMIVNDIPTELYVDTDQQKLAAVIGSLLNMMMTHSPNCAIHVTAKPFTNVMLLHLKSPVKMGNPDLTISLEHIEHLAKKIGGTVSITSYRNKITTVVLSFTHAGLAA